MSRLNLLTDFNSKRRTTSSEMRKIFLFLLIVWLLIGCSSDEEPVVSVPTSMYFPPLTGTEWETTSPAGLEWNEQAIEPLTDFLEETNTKSFMILVNGRIVMEEYFNGHSTQATWQWNSAGKTLVTSIVGIAQQNELLTLNDKASNYLGTEWTNTPIDKEELIQVNHLLSMTSGLDDTRQVVVKDNLMYVADAGTRWAYGNVFQTLINIVHETSDVGFVSYFNEHLAHKIGMNGSWNFGLIFTIYHSTTRDMARFGLLALNEGAWNGAQIIDKDFFIESISSSQTINPSYGYMWWLNGKATYMVPGSQEVFSGPLVPNAPSDMFAAMGANDQRIYVVPSKNLVVIRMGDAANPNASNFAVSGFDNLLWEKINDVIK